MKQQLLQVGLIFLLSLFLSSCDTYITEKGMREAYKLCEDHKGIKRFSSYCYFTEGDGFNVVCEDGKIFQVR